MPPELQMVIPSAASTIVFSAIVLAIAVSFVWAVHHSGLDRGDAPARVQRDTVRAAVAVTSYLALTAGVTAAGILAHPGPPPAMMLFFAVSNLTGLAVALSPLGTRFARHLPLHALLGFHAFRVPLELVLHRWYAEGVLPVQMTYEGYNFDVASGLGGLALGVWAWRSTPPRILVWTFNLLGTALLATVATIAVLSAPLPFRQFHDGPPVLLALHVPYSWIVPLCVAGALAAHVVLFRRLLARPSVGQARPATRAGSDRRPLPRTSRG